MWAVAVPCNDSDATQRGWSYEGGALQWTLGAPDDKPMCIDSLGGASALQLAPCSYLQPSQVFERKGAALEQGGSCLDVFEPDTPAYRRVDLYKCDGGANQQFDVADTSLKAHSNACVAVRTTPAGPPPPPPPPPTPPKAYISAFATLDSAVDAGLSGVRAFLSFWADPEATPKELPANRTVRVYVTHDGSTPPPKTATVYSIDDLSTHPAASWVAMGSPPKPNASEMAILMAASQVHTEAAVVVAPINASCAYIEVSMRANSVAVVAFGTGSGSHEL